MVPRDLDEQRFRELDVRSPHGHRVLERCVPVEPGERRGADIDPHTFHAGLPGYRATRLFDLTALGQTLGLDRLWVKDESSRFGLPAFKFLGAVWAAFRALSQRLDLDPNQQPWPFSTMRAKSQAAGIRLVTATEGNHGRAVARVARMFGCTCRVVVPAGMAPARITAIEAEGAEVEEWDGSYDDAVAAAAELESDKVIVLADTAWKGNQQIPLWVSEGYRTIFREIDVQLRSDPGGGPDIVFVQVGVGALASAVIQHYLASDRASRPLIVSVEPLSADCAFESAAAGHPQLVPGPHPSVMTGLNAGRVSPVVLPQLLDGISGFCGISDAIAEEAVRILADDGIAAGETGAAGLAGLLAVSREVPTAFGGLGRAWRRPLLLVTEGVTDPISHQRSLAAGGELP